MDLRTLLASDSETACGCSITHPHCIQYSIHHLAVLCTAIDAHNNAAVQQQCVDNAVSCEFWSSPLCYVQHTCCSQEGVNKMMCSPKMHGIYAEYLLQDPLGQNGPTFMVCCPSGFSGECFACQGIH